MEKIEIINKLKTIITKVIFPIEFIVALWMTYSMFRFIVLRNYQNMISVKHVIYIVASSILIGLIIIHTCKNNRDKIEKIVMSFLIPIGMLYVVFMLPSHVPDELGHLWRAYEVSEGFFISSKEPTYVPKDLVYHIKTYVNTYQEFNAVLSGTTDYNDRVEVNNTFKNFPPFLYFFSAIGFFIARMLNLNIILGCYLASIMNFIVFLVSAYYAIKIIPFGKWAITSVIFMPMFLHQATSTSADCIINSIAMLFISFVVYLLFKENKIDKKEQIIFFLLSVLLALCKYVYLPIIGMGLLLLFSKNMDKKQKAILLPTTMIVAVLLSITWFAFSNTYESPYKPFLEENNINVFEQAKDIIHHPVHYVKMIGQTLHVRGTEWIGQMVGAHLGWLNIKVPAITIITYIIVMLASCFIEKNKVAFHAKQKMWGVFLSITTIILVITGLYLTWTGVGNDITDGVQGRYFIPVLFLVMLCLCKRENYVKIKKVYLKLPIVLCLLNLSVLNTIYDFFK